MPYTEYDPNKVKQFLLQNGDLLFARTGATVGKSYLVESVPQNAIYASYLIRIRTVKEVLPEYLFYCSLSLVFIGHKSHSAL